MPRDYDKKMAITLGGERGVAKETDKVLLSDLDVYYTRIYLIIPHPITVLCGFLYLYVILPKKKKKKRWEGECFKKLRAYDCLDKQELFKSKVRQM